MKRLSLALATLLLTLVVNAALAQVIAVPNSMNFQGRLAKPNGTPVSDGNYTLRFRLYDAATNGNVKFEQTLSSVTVRNGVFAVVLSGFSGGTFNSNLWLGIKIGNSTELSPRQPLVSVPYAFKAESVKDGSITGASIANGAITGDKLASNLFSSQAWLLGGNAGTTASHFLGTTDNRPLVLKANGRQVMRYEDGKDANDTYHAVNVLGGAAINFIEAGVLGATIAGGGQDNNTGADSPNDIRGNFGSIGGGSGNFIDAFLYGTIAGGSGNNVQGNYATVGGGIGNNPQSDYATIGGGGQNYIFGTTSTISGGFRNSITASLATIAGGNFNSITGDAMTIGGGQVNRGSGFHATISGGLENVNSGPYGTIGGGAKNELTGFLATIAGGNLNKASGQYAFIGGGSNNLASANKATIAGGEENGVEGTFTTIGGGRLNYGWDVSDYSVISGGFSNNIFGDYATIPGGYSNNADGLASFAAGYRAYAFHNGSFVWADVHEADFISPAANQFCIRATGGIVLEAFGNVPIYTGVGTTEANRYVALLNSPHAPSASGLKAGGILCADSYDFASPSKNDMAIKGTLGVGYPNPAPYRFAVNGNIYVAGTYSSSDVRYKQNIAPFENALDTILNLRGVTFEWNKKSSPTQEFSDGRQVGFIAQEVERVLPELVRTDSKGYKAVAYSNIVPVLVEAMKQQQKQVEAAKARLQKAEAHNAQLKTQNAAMEARLVAIEQTLAELKTQRR